MAFSLFDFYFMFCTPIGFFALGSWFLLAPWWAENFVTPGFDEKTYIGDPLNELFVQLYGISLLLVAAVFYIVLKRAAGAGDGRTAGLLLGLPCAAGILVKIVVYGLFHSKHNRPFAFGPSLFLAIHVVSMLLAALFGWRFWSGQAPVQPQAPAKRPWDLFTVVFLVVKPAVWGLGQLVCALWPVEYLKWAAPAFVGTTAEPLYSFAPTVLFARLSAIVYLAANACTVIGGWRADTVTLRRAFVTITAALVAITWVCGDFRRRYPAADLASGPNVLLIAFCLEILANTFGIYYFLGGPVAAAPSPLAAPGPYGYPTGSRY